MHALLFSREARAKPAAIPKSLKHQPAAGTGYSIAVGQTLVISALSMLKEVLPFS